MTTPMFLACIASAIIAVAIGTHEPAHAKTPASTEPALRRYALVIGSNTGGGSGREKLRYAGHDAATVADVLRQLGGVNQTDLAKLEEPDKDALDDAPEFERFFFITADQPIDVGGSLASLRAFAQRSDRATAPLELPSGMNQMSLRLRKPSPQNKP